MKYWLCYGLLEKWPATVTHSRWGTKGRMFNGRMSPAALAWERVQPGDTLLFKMSDNKLYGWAKVKSKTENELRPIFPKELVEDAVIYDRRIQFDFVETCSMDVRHPVRFDALQPAENAAISPAEPIVAQAAIAAMKRTWESQAKNEFIELLGLHMRRDLPEAIFDNWDRQEVTEPEKEVWQHAS